jgi:Spy/CpxP family protein refolding chaperone
MKKFIAIASALFLIAGATQAQDSTLRKHDHRGGGKQPQFAQQLGLSESQKAEFKNLNESYRTQIKAVHDNTSLSKEDQKTKIEALRKQQHEKMQSLLTAEQKTKMASFQKKDWKGRDGKQVQQEEKEKMVKTVKKKGKDFAGKKGDRMKGGNPAELKEKLGLSDAQAQQLKASREQFQTKAKAIREDSKLTDEQKKAQMKVLAEQRQQSLKSVLTAEQIEKMKSAKGKRDRKQAK